MLHVDQQMPVLPHGTSAIKDSQDPSYPGNPLVTYLSLRTTGPPGACYVSEGSVLSLSPLPSVIEEAGC